MATGRHSRVSRSVLLSVIIKLSSSKKLRPLMDACGSVGLLAGFRPARPRRRAEVSSWRYATSDPRYIRNSRLIPGLRCQSAFGSAPHYCRCVACAP